MVQEPVSTVWDIDFGDPATWLDANGGQLFFYRNVQYGKLYIFQDYEMKLVLASGYNLPTDAELECSWGDGTTYKTLVIKVLKCSFNFSLIFQLNDLTITQPGDYETTIAHAYPTNGEYNVTCRCAN